MPNPLGKMEISTTRVKLPKLNLTKRKLLPPILQLPKERMSAISESNQVITPENAPRREAGSIMLK
jgi:hypothetical protein